MRRARRAISGPFCYPGARRLDKTRGGVFALTMNRRHLLILGALLLAGCATRSVYSAPDVGMVELEPLVAASVAADSLTIRVISTGCTAKEGFVFFVERGGGRYAVAFARRKLDLCKAAPTPVDLSWTFEELGLPKGARVAVVNPLGGR